MKAPIRGPWRRSTRRFVLLALVYGVLGLGAAMYFFNPFRTATDDPRGRVLGYMSYRIPTTSMMPTLMPGDVVQVDTTAYWKDGPRAGDVVAYVGPSFAGDKPPTYMHRVIARGGDRVEIRDAILYVNDQAVSEPYVAEGAGNNEDSRLLTERTVPPTYLFLLGDNRDDVHSRQTGYLPESLVIGRATDIVFSEDLARIGPVK